MGLADSLQTDFQNFIHIDQGLLLYGNPTDIIVGSLSLGNATKELSDVDADDDVPSHKKVINSIK